VSVRGCVYRRVACCACPVELVKKFSAARSALERGHATNHRHKTAAVAAGWVSAVCASGARCCEGGGGGWWGKGTQAGRGMQVRPCSAVASVGVLR